MIVDSSALVAIVLREPGWQTLTEKLSSRHAAALNFGDCITYAVASLAGQPLLYVGEDFSKTDLARV